MSLRLSEVYLSVQGEGPNVGKPTVFVRFGGCNLRCPGWPCDTQHAIDPKYRNEWEKHTVEELVTKIAAFGVVNICLTGGEPWLQTHDDLRSLVETLISRGHHVEAFTNGTLWYQRWWTDHVDLVMDWKLPSSGEGEVSLDNRWANIELMDEGVSTHGRTQSVKFVIGDRADYELAKITAAQIQDVYEIQVYYGVVWGKLELSELIKWVLDDELFDWNLNVQVHNYIWDRNQRGI